MIHDIDRHFGKTVKVSSQIIRNIYNKLYALYSGGVVSKFYLFMNCLFYSFFGGWGGGRDGVKGLGIGKGNGRNACLFLPKYCPLK